MTESPATNRWPDDDVILYDGVCVFCSRWVRFVAARDTKRRLRFTPTQSAYGTRPAQAPRINPAHPRTNPGTPGPLALFQISPRPQTPSTPPRPQPPPLAPSPP